MRLRDTDRKLRDALTRLVQGVPTHPRLQKGAYRLTVTTLAHEARVGRNAIYTNHRELIDKLGDAERLRIVPDKLVAWEDKFAQQRALIQILKIEERRMITENAALLKRLHDAETEADRHKRRNAKLAAEQDVAKRPASLTLPPRI
jgi:predicted transcriptional regulator